MARFSSFVWPGWSPRPFLFHLQFLLFFTRFRRLQSIGMTVIIIIIVITNIIIIVVIIVIVNIPS